MYGTRRLGILASTVGLLHVLVVDMYVRSSCLAHRAIVLTVAKLGIKLLLGIAFLGVLRTLRWK